LSLKVAFVSYEGLPLLSRDDRLAVDVLRGRGHTVVPAIWTDPSVDWASFDRVVLRSCWDYHQRIDEFRAWLSQAASLGVRLVNPEPTSRWNADKRYLFDLEAAGVRIVPSLFLRRGTKATTASLREGLSALGTAPAAIVVKPTVSATAWLAWCVQASADVLPDGLAEALAARDFLAQPLLPEIVNGEWSLVFFAGMFSHAVVKRPRDGEFRVQEEYGGRTEPATPGDGLVALAAGILSRAPGPTAYARVDGVETPDGFVLLELELLEPTLYLASDPAAPARFADALEQFT
jgi:glutathione synthase/RimK-type ligase-like ATP-grasp enzyme